MCIRDSFQTPAGRAGPSRINSAERRCPADAGRRMGRALRECPPQDCDKCVYGQDAGCQCCALVAQGTQEKTHEFDARDMNQTDPIVESPTSLRTSRCCLWPTPSRGRIRLPLSLIHISEPTRPY